MSEQFPGDEFKFIRWESRAGDVETILIQTFGPAKAEVKGRKYYSYSFRAGVVGVNQAAKACLRHREHTQVAQAPSCSTLIGNIARNNKQLFRPTVFGQTTITVNNNHDVALLSCVNGKKYAVYKTGCSITTVLNPAGAKEITLDCAVFNFRPGDDELMVHCQGRIIKLISCIPFEDDFELNPVRRFSVKHSNFNAERTNNPLLQSNLILDLPDFHFLNPIIKSFSKLGAPLISCGDQEGDEVMLVDLVKNNRLPTTNLQRVCAEFNNILVPSS